MRLATFESEPGVIAAGRVEDDEVVELPFRDLGVALREDDWPTSLADHDGDRRAIDDVRFLPPIPDPRKFICVGRNYLGHVKELDREVPKFPTIFAKFATALVGPTDDIVLPAASSMVDWEVELAIVIGRPVRNAGRQEAASAIAGFTVHNDVSVRDFQRRTNQWLQGKIFDHTGPLGPTMVTADETGVEPDLEIECLVDGRVMQHARTSEMLFGPLDLVTYISGICTLEPGDVIATGSPSGVGVARDPQIFLAAGQTLVTRISGIGELRNRCVDEADTDLHVTKMERATT